MRILSVRCYNFLEAKTWEPFLLVKQLGEISLKISAVFLQLTAVKLEYLTNVTKCPPCFLQTKGLPSSKKCGNLSHVAPFLKAGEYNWYQIMERLSLTSFFEQPSTIHDNNISNSLLIYVFFVFFFPGGGGEHTNEA